MRAPVWMVIALLLSISILDITSVWVVRSKIIRAAEMALDAALIGGVAADEAVLGRTFIDEDKGLAYALTIFKQNLQLNESLENQILQNTEFELSIIQDGDKPRISVQVKTTIRAISPQVVGMDGIPIAIRKFQYHISKYK